MYGKADSVYVPMTKVMKNVTIDVTVTGVKSYQIRFKVATVLIKLAALILRCGIKVEVA